MYPFSKSSSSQSSIGNGGGGGGLIRYGSAPGNLLTAAADSVIGAQPQISPSRFFHSESSKTTAMDNLSKQCNLKREEQANTTIGLQPTYGYSGGGGGGASHGGSPARSLNQLATAAGDRNGFSALTRGVASYNSKGTPETAAAAAAAGITRLNSQLSFTGKESLSRISEEAEEAAAAMENNKKSTHSYAAAAASGGAASFGMWEPSSNPIMFSVAQPSRGKNGLESMESQFQFSISQTAQDMASMEKLMNIPQDSVTCKIRAKRGFATHPRSIAERERRTRISGRLKKLQDLVPNMDKQTSYSDMLDLAVQHIKSLQDQVEKLHKDLDSCSCGCKKREDS